MRLKTLHILMIALISTVMTTGCDKQESKQESKLESMPEATDKTCNDENVKKFGEEFSHKCFLRGTYTKSSGRAW
jgi:entry exclusion lipoprotein TrbK